MQTKQYLRAQEPSLDNEQAKCISAFETQVLPANAFLQIESARREIAIKNGLPQASSLNSLCNAIISAPQNNLASPSYIAKFKVLAESLQQTPSLRTYLQSDFLNLISKVFKDAQEQFHDVSKLGLSSSKDEFKPQLTDSAANLIQLMEYCCSIQGQPNKALPYDKLSKLCMRAAQLELRDAGDISESDEFSKISASLARRYVENAKQAMHKGEIAVTPAVARFMQKIDSSAAEKLFN